MRSKSKVAPVYSPDSLGHWTALCEMPMTIENQEGFIYRITEKSTGLPYYGKKTFWTRRAGKRFAESDWRTYTGSSKDLNRDMLNENPRNFKYEILMLCGSKSVLNYCEIAIQVYAGALIVPTYNQMLGDRFMGKIPDRFKVEVFTQLEEIRKKVKPKLTSITLQPTKD